MKRWEYLKERFCTQDELNAYGAQGWEVVGFSFMGASEQIIFKRQVME